MQSNNTDITFEDVMQCYSLCLPTFGHSNHPFFATSHFCLKSYFHINKIRYFFRNEIQKSGKMRLMICLTINIH